MDEFERAIRLACPRLSYVGFERVRRCSGKIELRELCHSAVSELVSGVGAQNAAITWSTRASPASNVTEAASKRMRSTLPSFR